MCNSYYTWFHGLNCRLITGIWYWSCPLYFGLINPTQAFAPRPARSKCQTPMHGHRLRTCCTTNSPPTDKNLPHHNARAYISTCQDVGMWQIFVRWWQICCTTSCRIVVSLSVGGVVQHVRIAGVRVVEFGSKRHHCIIVYNGGSNLLQMYESNAYDQCKPRWTRNSHRLAKYIISQLSQLTH